jgi:lipopolysaccharide/colanic/teichoic acid biosynthesis glycosyltransferase
VKRVLDVVMAALALVLLAPVMLAVAAAVRWEVGPQVLFRQVRVGLDDRPFTLLKFRSLRPPEGSAESPVWSISGDARLGPVGRMIRATSLDELPQLFNILRGEMSFVGPRPERPRFVEQFTQAVPRYAARHRAPAGLTGWAQVNGLRGDTSIEERVRFDNSYIQNWSLWLDVKILVRTIAAVVLRRGS